MIKSQTGTGGRIAFASDRDGNFEIYVMDADGSNQTRLTNTPGREQEVEWSLWLETSFFTPSQNRNFRQTLYGSIPMPKSPPDAAAGL